MFLVLLSDPSMGSMIALKIVQTIFDVSVGPYDWIAVATAIDFQKAWAARQHEHGLFFADCPDAEISNVLRESQLPLIVALQQPVSAARQLRAQRGGDVVASIRATAQSFASLHDLALAPNAHRLTIATAPVAQIEALVDQLAGLMQISMSTARRSEVLGKVNAVVAGNDLRGPDGDLESNADDPLIERSLLAYASLVDGGPMDGLNWPTELFMSYDGREGSPLKGPVDLTGPPRMFIFGPFMHLPTGNWRAEAQFQVYGNYGGNDVQMDIYSNGVLSVVKFPLPREGRFVAEIDFSVREPRSPIELRFHALKGAIEGLFELIDVEVIRLDRGEASIRTRA